MAPHHDIGLAQASPSATCARQAVKGLGASPHDAPKYWRVMRRYLAVVCLGALLLPVAGSGQPSPAAYDGAFTFTRIRYGSSFGRGGGSWAHDYPRADQHLPRILAELTTMRPRVDDSVVLDLEDDALFHHPVIYISEPGFWTVTDDGADRMRSYLLKGGFVIFDDF